MNVTKVTSTTVKTYTVRIEGGEIRPQPFSRVGREYRVDSIEVVKRDGNVSRVTIAGGALKKDGSVGQLRADERFYRASDWPAWLRSVVEGLA